MFWTMLAGRNILDTGIRADDDPVRQSHFGQGFDIVRDHIIAPTIAARACDVR